MEILDLAGSAEDVKDLNAGGTEFKPPREGIALLRLCSYIELGTYEGDWKGKPKLYKKVLVEFELVHPDHKILDKEGNFRAYHKIMVRLNKSGHAKSKYMALFNKLNYDGQVHVEKDKIPALSKFLGHAFLGQVYHHEYKDKIYANLDKDGQFSIQAPRSPVMEMGVPTGKYEDIPVPEMNSKPRLFLWDAPGMPDSGTHKMWESIYIEGENDDGKSKNWIQEMILSDENVALTGSKVEQLFVEKNVLDDEFSTDDPSLA